MSRRTADPELITDDAAFDRLFRDFRHTAWRLEVRTNYSTDDEDPAFLTWLGGQEPSYDWLQPWMADIRRQTAAGKRVERVRVVDDPPSDYMRFEIWLTPKNLEIGEDIRYLPRAKAHELALPQCDFWLFDTRTVVILHFGDEDDHYRGFEVVDDPAEVLRFAQARDAAWHHALTYEEYQARRAAQSG